MDGVASRLNLRFVLGVWISALIVLALALLAVDARDRFSLQKLENDARYAIGYADTVDIDRAHPDVLFAVAEGLLSAEGAPGRAIPYVEAGLEKAPDNAFGWALLAYLRAQHNGELDRAGLDAFRRSIELSPFESRQLIKWRLSFAIENWDRIPGDLRWKVFQAADLLDWWYAEYDFLRAQRQRAEGLGLPYNAYRQATRRKRF